MKLPNILLIALLLTGLNSLSAAERARDMGIEFFGAPGKNNAITDVQGVTVGYSTIIKDLEDGKAARTGSVAGNSSGDIFLAFSTANSEAFQSKDLMNIQALQNEDMDNLFEATVEATEEAIINALVAAKTMTGNQGHTFPELDKDFLKKIFKQDKLRDSL